MRKLRLVAKDIRETD